MEEHGGQCVRIVAMTTLTSFLSNGMEGFSIEGCANTGCAYTLMGVGFFSREKGLGDVFRGIKS